MKASIPARTWIGAWTGAWTGAWAAARALVRTAVLDLATIALGATIIAGLVHVVAILIIPLYATNDAFARLSRLGPTNATILIPQASAKARLFPYGDPAVAAVVCRYDLRDGPLRVKAPVARYEFSSISFHNRRGDIFYALTDRAATQNALEALVVTDQQLRAISARESEDESARELRIVSSTDEGFVLMRSFSQAPSLMAEAEERASALKCQPESPPQ
jgi:uncharacterized membrane protein